MSAALLAWYDAHARVLPWRIGPAARRAGQRPDPYRVWLSEIMLQQTTVAAVRERFLRFTRRWPDVASLAAAADADVMAEWAGLGYYARARNLLACARAVVSFHDGRFPETAAALARLPGIGPYTAAAIAAIAFDEAATVVDGNVERVVARLHAVQDPLPGAKAALAALAARLTPAARPGDHAQAMMDLGATVCTPRSPACGSCPLAQPCRARALGIAALLPRRAPAAARPLRRGIAYVGLREDGAVLLERRPDRGLLGGMLGFPGSDWAEEPAEAPPAAACWRDAGRMVRHVFTHFELELAVRTARLPADARAERGSFVAPQDFRPSSLPSVMRKVWEAAAAGLAPPGPGRG
ncbi:MAG: NUDIX domain-containing protein [Rhodobacteraceae bacterium]|nr:NUDIX domain-containing protein [Paracoccaceae bacterium]